METVFTPWMSFGGGVLIGVGAVLLMLAQGRIAGATGILAGVLMPSNVHDWSWRAATIAGMVSAPVLTWLVTGEMPTIEVPVTTAALVAGGLIVGVGVTYGSGCTSGHGVCGMARLSVRSMTATLTFMITTFATVFVVRHLIGG